MKQPIAYVNPRYPQFYIKVRKAGEAFDTILCMSTLHPPFPGDHITDRSTGNVYELIRQNHEMIEKGSKAIRTAPFWTCKLIAAGSNNV